jgi:hypothetical protein
MVVRPVDRPAPAETRVPSARRLRPDALALIAYLAGAVWVTARLWIDRDAVVRGAPADEIFFEWVLAHAARVVTHLENPFFSTRLNPPAGVNLMANTSVLGLSIPAAPLTSLLGAHLGFVALLGACLCASAFAWYFVLSRHLVRSRAAAFLGGAVCGYGPGVIVHAQGRLNLVATFLVPFIGYRLLRLARPGDPVRDGILLGLLVAYQVLISEEILFTTGLTVAITAAVSLASRPDLRRREVIVRGTATLAIAAAVALTLVGYPLWIQFFGPQHYRGIMATAAHTGTALDAYLRLPVLSVGAWHSLTGHTPLPLEDNSYLGPGLVILLIIYGTTRRRDPLVGALGLSALILATLSVGPVRWGPYRVLAHLPLFDSLVPSRLALAVLFIAGVLVARAGDDAAHAADRAGRRWTVWSRWYAIVTVALLPIAPVPLPTVRPQPVPPFITAGTWRRYVDDRHALVTVPPTTNEVPNGMRLAAAARLGFRLANGYFLGPAGKDDPRAGYTPAPRFLTRLLMRVHDTGTVPALTDTDRRQAVDDLRYWRAAAVLLPPGYHESALHRTVDLLLGPGTRVGGAWVWDVRPLVR